MFFFFNDTATTEIYTLSLHDALPILAFHGPGEMFGEIGILSGSPRPATASAVTASRLLQLRKGDFDRLVAADRKSTRLNSSHANISYAVFCLKKKKKKLSHYIVSIDH